MAEVIDRARKLSSDIDALEQTQPRPQGRWEIDMLFYSAERNFRGRAVIDFDGAERIISQRVDMTVSNEGAVRGGTMPVDVEGLVTGQALTLDIYILDAPFRHDGFKAVAEQSLDGQVYEGRYQMECVNPDACDCGGMEGPFALRRLGG